MNADTGLAPNPFWGYCTLALCTPNHQGVRAEEGDWIIGTTGRTMGPRLIYAMELTELRLDLDGYFRDPRFAQKKPIPDGSWRQRVGDNMYYRAGGRWQRLESQYHQADEDRVKDTRYACAFVSRHFFYFGADAVQIPNGFQQLVRDRQGCKWYAGALVAEFITWLERECQPGIHAHPADRETDTCTGRQGPGGKGARIRCQ